MKTDDRATLVSLAKAKFPALDDQTIDKKSDDELEMLLKWRRPVRDMRDAYELGN